MTATDQNLGKQSFEYDQNDRNLMKSSFKSSSWNIGFHTVTFYWKMVPFLEHNVEYLLNFLTGYYENDRTSFSEFVDKIYNVRTVPK